jgi:hypothetical protein
MSNIGGTGGSSSSQANNIGSYNLDEINQRLEEMDRRMDRRRAQRELERTPSHPSLAEQNAHFVARRMAQFELRNSRPDRNSSAGRESRRRDGSPTDIARAA